MRTYSAWKRLHFKNKINEFIDRAREVGTKKTIAFTRNIPFTDFN